jgi:predicted transcriptional regulator
MAFKLRARLEEATDGAEKIAAASGEEAASHGSVQVHVGESLEAMGERFIDAWHRAKRGEHVRERYVGFETWEGLVRALSPKRFELLRHVHRKPTKNIRALAQELGRDYRRVYEDVAALEAVGLLERDKDGVRTEYDALDVRVKVSL